MSHNPWRAKALTLFPAMFPGPLGLSLAGKALTDGRWSLETLDIRDFSSDKHRTVDEPPFGGGAGLILKPDVVDAAVCAAKANLSAPVIYLTPRGPLFNQQMAIELAAGPGAIILCGRFEGVDERVIAAHAMREISIGDYVLSGGEPAALVLIDACVRLLPGVMGNPETAGNESFGADGLLEHPHYTRPAEWQGHRVPEVLLSGHHKEVAKWRHQQAEVATKERRPDLWVKYLARQNGENL